MTASVFDQVRNVASDIFGIPADKITAESSPETIENWDSIQHLNLVLAVEEKFGVQLDPEDIEQMKNIGAVAKFEYLELADLVGQGLAGPTNIAVNFRLDTGVVDAGVVMEELDHLVAGPVLGVDAGVDD